VTAVRSALVIRSCRDRVHSEEGIGVPVREAFDDVSHLGCEIQYLVHRLEVEHAHDRRHELVVVAQHVTVHRQKEDVVVSHQIAVDVGRSPERDGIAMTSL